MELKIAKQLIKDLKKQNDHDEFNFGKFWLFDMKNEPLFFGGQKVPNFRVDITLGVEARYAKIPPLAFKKLNKYLIQFNLLFEYQLFYSVAVHNNKLVIIIE